MRGKERVRHNMDIALRASDDDPHKCPHDSGKLHAIGITHRVALNDRTRASGLMEQRTDKKVTPPPAGNNNGRPAKRSQASRRAGEGGTISEDEKSLRTGKIGVRGAGEGKAGGRVQPANFLKLDTQPKSRPPFCQARCERVGVEDFASRAGIRGAALRVGPRRGMVHPSGNRPTLGRVRPA